MNCFSAPLKQMQDLARRIARISNEAKLEVDEDVYVERFKPFLMDVVFAWCNGATFGKLCEMTDIYEGKLFLAIEFLNLNSSVVMMLLLGLSYCF